MIDALRGARRVVVVTGAGVSAESGIPTFRDALEGLWSKYDPMQLATPEAFQADPELVTRWYDSRRIRCAACEPNNAHRSLAGLQRAYRSVGRTFELVTQNVDRLHQRAGSDEVIELHGSLFVWRCVACGSAVEQAGGAFEVFPPVCDTCGGSLRPGVVWFGEELPRDAITRAYEASGECDVFLSVGTSSVVYPAAGLIDAARACGARTIEINRDETPISADVDWALRGPAGEVLPAVEGAIGGLS